MQPDTYHSHSLSTIEVINNLDYPTCPRNRRSRWRLAGRGKPLNLVQGTSRGSIDHVFKGCSAIAVMTKPIPNDWIAIDQENLDQEINSTSKKKSPSRSKTYRSGCAFILSDLNHCKQTGVGLISTPSPPNFVPGICCNLKFETSKSRYQCENTVNEFHTAHCSSEKF